VGSQISNTEARKKGEKERRGEDKETRGAKEGSLPSPSSSSSVVRQRVKYFSLKATKKVGFVNHTKAFAEP
jgi:hypothetical protein